MYRGVRARRLTCSRRSFATPVSYAMAYCREQPRSVAAPRMQRPDEDAHCDCAVQIEMARRTHAASELGGCWYEAGPRRALSGSMLREQRAVPTYLSSNTACAKQSPCLLCAHRNLRRRVRARTSRSCCKKLLKEISVCGHESREAYRNSRVPTGRTGYLARLHSQIPAVLVPAAGARLLEG